MFADDCSDAAVATPVVGAKPASPCYFLFLSLHGASGGDFDGNGFTHQPSGVSA